MTTAAERVQQRLSTIDLFERTFRDQVKALEAHMARERQESADRHGQPHDRRHPRPGATKIVPDETIAWAQDVIIGNGLRTFESSTTLRISIKETDTVFDVMMPPVDCHQAVVHYPDRSCSHLEIHVTDWLFPSRDGEVPREYIRAVANGVNPAASISVIPEAELTQYIARAHEAASVAWVKKVIATQVLGWRKRQAPCDLATVQEYSGHSLVHEYAHGLILSLPADDTPADRRSTLEGLTFERYVDLVLHETSIHQSVALFKNLLKALKAVRMIRGAASQYTRDSLFRVLAVETFCDRFSMYLIENHLRDRAAHVFIQKYGDPPITDRERAFFEPLLDLLRERDREGIINEYSHEHAESSTVIKVQPLLAHAM